MSDGNVLRIEIEGKSLDDIRAFTDEIQPDLGCRPVALQKDNRFVITAYVPEAKLEEARSSRSAYQVRIHVVENATKVGRKRMLEVGTGNRFATRDAVPQGLGRKE